MPPTLEQMMSKLGYLFRAAIVQESLEPHLPAHARSVFQDLLNGGDGAEALSSFPNEWRGAIALWLYYRLRAGVCATAQFRDVLNDAWNHDRGVLLRTVNNRQVLRAMFRRADFLVPDHLALNLNIWHGASGSSLKRMKRAISWTTNRLAAEHSWHFPRIGIV